MVYDLGTVRPGSTQYIPFHTFDSNDPSASVTLTGLAVTDIEVYKDGGTTQRASDAGYTLLDTDGIDFDGITGVHGFSIDLSDNTTAGFWEAGSRYWVVVSSVTVDAATINFIAATFRIGYPGAVLDTTIATLASQLSFTLTAGSADNDAYNSWRAVIHDAASAIQVAVGFASDYVGSTKTLTLRFDPGIYTMAAGDNISLFPPDTANVVQWRSAEVTTPFVGGVPNVNVDYLSRDATAADNAELFFDGTGYAAANSTIGTCTTNTDMRGTDSAATAAALATVDSIVDAILTDTDTTIPALIAALNDLSAAQVNAEVVDVLETDTHAESTVVPAATASLKDKIVWLATLGRNKILQTATTQTLRNDGDSGDIATATVSDDGATATRGEWT